jgi:hypothetical protein
MLIEGPAAPDLMIAELEWRARAQQQVAKALLPLREWPRADGFAIEVEEIKQEKDESVAVTGVRCGLDQAEGGCAIGADAAQLPVEISLSAESDATAAAIAGYLCVQSRPVRVSSRTAPRSSRACIRYPSNLISWSHPGPSGGWSTSLVSCGFTQPGSAVASTRRLAPSDRVMSASGKLASAGHAALYHGRALPSSQQSFLAKEAVRKLAEARLCVCRDAPST